MALWQLDHNDYHGPSGVWLMLTVLPLQIDSVYLDLKKAFNMMVPHKIAQETKTRVDSKLDGRLSEGQGVKNSSKKTKVRMLQSSRWSPSRVSPDTSNIFASHKL